MSNHINPLYSFASMAEFIREPVKTIGRWFHWDVVERPVIVGNDDDESTYTNGAPNVITAPKYKAIVRTNGNSTEDKLLHIAPSSYEVITNSQFEDIIADYEQIGCEYIEHGTFNDGRQLWCQLESKLLAPWLVGGVDEGKTKVTLLTSHNGTLALKMVLIMERMFCQNQLPMLTRASDVGFVIKHTASAKDKISIARKQIHAIGALAHRAVESFRLLNVTPINQSDNEKFFAELFGLKKEIRITMVNGVEVPSREPEYSGKALKMLEALEDAYRSPLQSDLSHNAWRLLNAITYYVDHHPHIRESRREKGYAMIGAGAHKKRQAYDKLMTLALVNKPGNGWEPSGLIQ